jgi:hypothetical protein
VARNLELTEKLDKEGGRMEKFPEFGCTDGFMLLLGSENI